MNLNFDLNTENYTKQELIEMFGLPEHFDKNILDMKEVKLRENIIHNQKITKEVKEQTIQFLVKAKNIILNDTFKKDGELINNIKEFYNSSFELKHSNVEDTQDHIIQKRQEKPYLSSYPSEFFSGVINPLKKRTVKMNLNVDTRFRENYSTTSSSNFNIQLPSQFNDVVQMQLSVVELPSIIYAISNNYGDNYFTIKISLANNTTQTAVIIIPNGNYTKDTIMTAINAKLADETMGVNFASEGSKTNIAISDSSITSVELDFQSDKNGGDGKNLPLQLKLGWILGFRSGHYTGEIIYVSEAMIDIIRPKYVYLVIDDYNNNVNNSFYSAFKESILNKNILARISLIEGMNPKFVSNPREYFGPVNIHTINVQLLDEYGRPVDLNGMDFSFCLSLTTAYDI